MGVRMTRTLRNLLFSVLTALGLLGGAELCLRLVGWPDPGLYAGDPGSVWWLRPGLPPREVPFPEGSSTFTVRTNSLGFRGPEPTPGAWLCLGDSTTFGWGVEEDEAWPAQVAALRGEPVINGGTPGYSSFQGLARLDHALSTRPARVILAFLVRDADAAPVPDHLRRARTAPDLHLLRALTRARGQRSAGPPTGPSLRVPPEQYGKNIHQLITRTQAAGAEVAVLAFPMQRPPEAHLAALEAGLLRETPGVPLLRPALPADSFFPNDPIHLTPEGHRRLAQAVVEAWP